MTDLAKPIRRKTLLKIDNRINPRPEDFVVVTLYPCNEIGFRASGRRREVRLPLATAYRLALSTSVREEQQNDPPKRRRVKRGLLALGRQNAN